MQKPIVNLEKSWGKVYWKRKKKMSKELKQLQDNAKIAELLAKQIAQYEFDKAEYQRTGIQH